MKKYLLLLILFIPLIIWCASEPGNVGSINNGGVAYSTYSTIGGANTTTTTNGTVITIASTASGGGGSQNITAQWATYAAYGSTDTKIMRFSTQVSDTGAGTAWNITTNAANAMTITILQAGQYSMQSTIDNANGAAAGVVGFSKNSNQLTTDIFSITDSNRLSWVYTSALPANHAFCSWQGYLSSNDVIRVHTQGSVPTTATSCNFSINQIAR